MRIQLAHNSLYYPSYGGGDKSNRLLMEALAAQGHDVLVVARVEHFGSTSHAKLLRDMAARGVQSSGEGAGHLGFRLNGVGVRVLTREPFLRAYFSAQIESFDPDIILTSTDDPAHLMLQRALQTPRARVVYLIRATVALPFGPDSAMRSEAKTAALRCCDGVVAVSEYVARYAREWGQLDAVHVPISLLEAGEYPRTGRMDNRFVTMINPCGVKGLPIFLGLAERLPDVAFAAVPTWGTTAADMAALSRLPNVTVLNPVDDIHEVFEQTRVALVPSLWAEARSRIILEAMARGIPVMASHVGGLAEAMLGMDYLLPVNPVVRYQPAMDELMVPMAEIPPQDIAPWQSTLERLLSDRSLYEDLSARSRDTALAYARNLTAAPFESYLREIAESPKRSLMRRGVSNGNSSLTLEKRLLALRIKRRNEKHLRDADDYWFHVYRPQPGDVIVDIGAGRGEDVFAFSRAVGAAGRVIAIEPHPASFRVLQKFCRLNRLNNVTALNYACLDEPAELQIETLPVWESNYVRSGPPSLTSHPITGVRFDRLCEEQAIGCIDYLKMNIEGAERLALPGCRNALARTRFVTVAAHDFRADRGEGEEFRTLQFVRDFLAAAGFDLVTRDGDPRYYVPYHVHGVRGPWAGARY